MAMTGADEEYSDLDLTSDLAENNGGTSVPAGSSDAALVPDGTTITEQTTTEREPKSTSLRDQLSNAFNQTPDSDTTTKPVEEVTPKPSLTLDAEGRHRRLDGTFASAEEVLAFTQADVKNTVDVDALTSQLPAAVAQEFKSLPAKSQEFFARTMEDLNSRASRYSEYDQLETLISPRRGPWAENGLSPLVAVSQLFQLSDFASTKPDDFILWFAESNNIDLDELLDARDAAAAGVNPEVRELQSQVAQLSNLIARQNGSPQVIPQQNDNLQVVQNFASEKDEVGKLKRPYLDEVVHTLPAHISAVRAENPTMAPDQVLAKAYENACWATPQVRAKLQAEIDAQRRDAARAKTQAARAASSTIRGGASGGTTDRAIPPNTNMSLRETIKYAFDEHAS